MKSSTASDNKREWCLNGKLNQNIDNFGFHSRTYTIPIQMKALNLMHTSR